MKNILVALNYNVDNEILIENAVNMAKCFQSKIWLIHVAAPNPDFVGYEAGPQFTRDQRAKELREEHVWIQTLADTVLKNNIACEGLLIQGSTVETIIEQVHKTGADLMILSYHKHSFLHEMWYGNNATEIMEKISVPVLIIPVRK